MVAKIKKDIYVRKFLFFEANLFFNLLNVTDSVLFFTSSFKKKVNTSLIKNNCVFSNRSRSVFKRFKCSRIFLRNCGLSGSACNFLKQSFSSYGGTADTIDSKSIAIYSIQVQILLRVCF